MARASFWQALIVAPGPVCGSGVSAVSTCLNRTSFGISCVGGKALLAAHAAKVAMTNVKNIDVPKMFRALLRCHFPKRLAVACHQYCDLIRGLSKMEQGLVPFCL